MSFGPRFINVLDEYFRGVFLPDITGVLERFVHDRDGPLAVYLSRPAVISRNLALPPRITLMFGPEGKLAITRGVHLSIEGETDLGRDLRFILGPDAQALLFGPLDAIRPEWFRGAVVLRGEEDGFISDQSAVTEYSDDRAIEAAVGCTIARIERGVAPVPIKLAGPYRLRRPVRIPDRAAGEEIELFFEGRHPRGDDELTPTFRRHRDSYTAHALWSVGAGVRIRARHIAFEARTAEELPPGADPAAVVHTGFVDGTLYERCTFFFDQGVGVWCEARQDAQRDPRSRGVPERISFVGCCFQSEPVGAPGTTLKLVDAGPSRLRIDGCSFRGDAAAMIAAVSGLVDVAGCDFHNEPNASKRSPTQAGVDLLLGTSARDASKPSGMPGPLVLNLTHVQTRSIRHLSGMRQNTPGGSVVSLSGLVARRRSFVESGAVPIIRWQGALGDGFLLQGSDVEGPVVRPEDPDGRLANVVATRLR